MTDWQINSMLLALHNIARAIGDISMLLFAVAFSVFWLWVKRYIVGRS